MMSEFASLDYLNYPSHHWPQLLNEKRSEGWPGVSSHIFWGAHERSPGIYDFSKSPRLRLEKLLRLVQDFGFSAEVTLGFVPNRETFPPWALESSKHAIVPYSFWDPSEKGFLCTELPSLSETCIRRAYLDFLKEVFSLLQLYQHPQGPLKKIDVKLGMYACTLNLTELEDFIDYLTTYYGDFESLNRIYGTGLRHAFSLASSITYQTLLSKRPWIAAFDYKRFRHAWLSKLKKEILFLETVQPLKTIVSFSDGVWEGANIQSEWEILIDPVLLETDGVSLLPFFPSGIPFAPSFRAFRLAEYIRVCCANNKVKLTFLPILGEEVRWVGSLAAIFTGKYMSRSSFETCHAHVLSGGKIFFPFGIPQYDQGMTLLEWGKSQDRKLEKLGDENLLVQKVGNGIVYCPAEPGKYGFDLWEWLKRKIMFMM
ncbi:MAG: beta-galactosidase [Deltaproteobacteria bacterium]|nr:beta-galactosidase [Deltaproteobacteria bacterium]